MEAFQERMIAEFKELDDRTTKLEDFINKNQKFKELDERERALQHEQLAGMRLYREALKGRIDHQGLSLNDNSSK